LADPLLVVENLHTWFPIKKGVLKKTVGWVRAVDGVSLTVPRGHTVALVGESGSGKTTVARSILGILTPREGTVLFDGTDLLSLSPQGRFPYKKKLQIVFQDPTTSLDPRMRIRDIVAEGMQSFGIGKSENDRTDRVADLLARVQLDPAQMYRYPHEFSGGQRQRIGIARALSVEPELIILDEAVSALDVSIQAQLLNLLADLQHTFGLSYLFITHDLSIVRYLADRVSVMYLGQIVEEADAAELFRAPSHPYTRGLLAAVPSIQTERRLTEVKVLGDVPSPANPPPGCRFHTRCPEAFGRCRCEQPPLYPAGQGVTRCFLSDPGSAGREPPA
jgi:oligopeptide/dipeptide ABC transporter ATP-binding protein